MKKIIKLSFVAAFAVIAGYNVYVSQKTSKLSDLALNNVEALAWSGESGSLYHLYPCPYSSGNECMMKQDPNRPECYAITYCR